MERTTLFVDVIVPLAVPKKYTYRVPAELNAYAETGRRALVQFGKSKLYSGIIASVHEVPPADYTAKYIDSVIDEAPVVTEQQLKLWDWIAFYYMCGPGEVMNAALPSALKLSSVSNIQLNPDFNFEEADHDAFSSKEHQIIEALHHSGTLGFDDVSQLLGVKNVHAIINSLLKKNAVSVYEEVKDKYKPKLIPFIQLHQDYTDEAKLKELLDRLEKKAFKQAEALLYFLHLSKIAEHKTMKWIRKSELLAKSDNSPVASLIKKNILIEQLFEVGRLLFENKETVRKELTQPQEQALQRIRKGFETHEVALLHGVTGSGKTEVYARLIEEVLSKGRQVLFLLPEIALTTQLITRMRAYFGGKVGVYHSKFSENERVEIWNNVLRQDQVQEENQYRVILGARSALFLPYSNLGLIIIDEEHDNSFKQHDPAPRYHARDTAIYLA
ncbi:MAG: primosomal protein N' family DNA-binding protein, partial [Bacteroidia bacterium]